MIQVEFTLFRIGFRDLQFLTRVEYLSISYNSEHFSLPSDIFVVCDFVKFDG
jgi:hypothetical protein